VQVIANPNCGGQDLPIIVNGKQISCGCSISIDENDTYHLFVRKPGDIVPVCRQCEDRYAAALQNDSVPNQQSTVALCLKEGELAEGKRDRQQKNLSEQHEQIVSNEYDVEMAAADEEDTRAALNEVDSDHSDDSDYNSNQSDYSSEEEDEEEDEEDDEEDEEEEDEEEEEEEEKEKEEEENDEDEEKEDEEEEQKDEEEEQKDEDDKNFNIMLERLLEFKKSGKGYHPGLDELFPLFRGKAPEDHPHKMAFSVNYYTYNTMKV
jgi:hypothetical protein